MYNTPFHTADFTNLGFLVTGGAGFIGSNIVQYLLKYGASHVRVLDNLATGSMENLKPYLQNKALEFVEGDISNPDTCHQTCKDIDYVLHQAALGSVPRSVKDPQSSNNANVTGFVNMLVAAKEKKVKRLVYASSSSVYGDSPHLPKTEEQIGKPLSPYAVTKRVNELYADVFAKTYGMEILGLRYFNIFGPNQSPSGPYAAVIPLFMSAVLNNQSPCINGDGYQSRDFTFVENAVEANIKALFCPTDQCNGGVFNIAVGERTTVRELFEIIKETANSNVDITFREEREGDIKHSLADISKAISIMEYKPAVKIRKGIKITFDWFRKKYFPDLQQ
jgi:UDP-N-acetylglucosamine/UDP-N-acetylgalactosamine 4-epimerase